MNTTEKLKQIRAKCVDLLAVAEQRTKGEWTKTTTPYTNTYYRIAVAGLGRGLAYLRGGERDEYDARFIASCAGSAEAGWKVTISEIDYIFHSNLVDSFLSGSIIAAWEGLL